MGAAHRRTGGFLGEPSLSDLFQASEVFEPVVRGVGPADFAEAVHGITGEDKEELGALFARIDDNGDGLVSWDEILSYLHQQQVCRLEPTHAQHESRQYTCLEREPPPSVGLHKEPVYTLAFVQRCAAYVTAAHDGTMRVWHAGTLQLALTRRLSDRADVSVNAMHQLPHSFAKLAIATADRMVTFFELADLPTISRWSVHGRIYLQEIPISLASFAVGPGDVLQCLAVGDVKGKVHIYDATRLMERLWKELDRAHQVRTRIRFSRHSTHTPSPYSTPDAPVGSARPRPTVIAGACAPCLHPHDWLLTSRFLPPLYPATTAGAEVCGATTAGGADAPVVPARHPLAAWGLGLAGVKRPVWV